MRTIVKKGILFSAILSCILIASVVFAEDPAAPGGTGGGGSTPVGNGTPVGAPIDNGTGVLVVIAGSIAYGGYKLYKLKIRGGEGEKQSAEN